MQLINNQYKVLDKINEDKTFSVYKVQDILKVNNIKYLMAIEYHKETEGFISYMKDNIYDYSNLYHPNLVQFYFFNKISQIDNKPVSTNKYYFTYEYFVGKNLFENLSELEFEERLDLAVQLCAVVKYLHLRGFLICNINFNDLYIVKEGSKQVLKLTTVPLHKNSKISNLIDKDNKLFRAPELYQNKKFDVYSDIYALGIILFYMLNDIKIENANFREDIYDAKLNGNANLMLFRNIIAKCTNLDPKLRYEDVASIVKDINRLFNKSYNIIYKEYIEKMPRFRAKLIPEQKQLNKIAAVTNKYFYENNNIKSIKIEYTEGAAQEGFIKNLSIRCEQEGYSPTVLNNNSEHKEIFGYIAPFIKQLALNCDKDLVSKYNEVLSIITDEASDVSNLSKNEDLIIKYKYRFINFIFEAVSIMS